MLRLLCLLLLSTPVIAEEGTTPSKSERIAILADTRIKESSGLARSLRHEGIFWTHNDSGGEPCLFAIDLQGRTRAKVRLREAVNFDWEDMTSGYDEAKRPTLFIGDIGDNLLIRRSIQIYHIPEPDISPAGQPVTETTVESHHWHATYPGGAQNAESLLFHPQTHRIHILTKSDDGKSTLYAFPEKIPTSQKEPIMLEKITDLLFPGQPHTGKRVIDDRMCTAADFSPDSRHLIVSTYSSLYEWTLSPGKSLAESLAEKPIRIVPDLLRQLEAVCYDADSRTLWLTSEHLPTPLIKVSR
ncbi:MAG: hypothetical protein IPK32_17215 [Verrucomicrobiaceae bacterium]|nr:hypothetical protein [Verrucomicrobiaceae bacterium]